MQSSSTSPDLAARRARVAVSALFLTNGALFANLFPRYPEVKAGLGMDDAFYGLVLVAYPIGAILSGLAAAAIMRRFGSARTAVVGTIGAAVAIMLAGFAPSPATFAVALFIVGTFDSVTDVAQNAHGMRVQRRFGRSIINSFHAVWSVGAVLGGLMSAGAIAMGLPLGVHLAISAAVFTAVALWALRACLPGPDDSGAPEGDPTTAGAVTVQRGHGAVVAIVIALVVLAITGTLVEDAANTWSAVYLSQSLGAPAAVAALGFIALVGAQFIGRLLGDPLVDRFGARLVALTGALIATVGMALALAFPSVPGTIAGFAAAGLGVATLVPAAMQRADELPGLRPGTGITVVSWLMRLGFLLSPPVVGALSDATDLRTALLLFPIATAAAFALAFLLQGRRATMVVGR